MEDTRRSFVFYLLFVFCVGCVFSEMVKSGTTYTFQPTVSGKSESLDWRHNGKLVVEWDEVNQPDPYWYRYKDRAHVNVNTGEFTMEMKKEDSGEFKGQFQVKGVLQYFTRTVTVIDPISKPKVTCVRNDTGVTLLCSLDPPMTAEFEWSTPAGKINGKSVHIPRAAIPADSPLFVCTAANEVSRNTREFSLSDCPKENGPHLIIGFIIGTIIIIGLVGTGAFFILKKKKKDTPGAARDEGTPLAVKSGENGSGVKSSEETNHENPD